VLNASATSVVTAEPFRSAASPEAFAQRFLLRQRKLKRAMLLVGVLLFIGGLTGFGIYAQRQKTLLRTGLHVTATVVAVSPYLGGSGLDPNTYDEHVNVEFANQSGKVVVAQLGIGESDPYRTGEPVQIVYNPSDPSQAVFSSGYTDIGSAGFWFFGSLALGFCLASFALRRLAMIRRAKHTLPHTSRSMTATSRLLPRGRFRRWAISLSDQTGPPVHFWSWNKVGCPLLKHGTDVTVFGNVKPRSVVIAVEPNHLVTVAGWIPRRWREPKRRPER
jgi:hypothetical protein